MRKTQKYTVIEFFDGDSFRVSPSWGWEDREDDIVRAYGYDTPEKGKPGYDEAKRKSEDMIILNNKIEIGNIYTIDNYGRLLADVYYRGKN